MIDFRYHVVSLVSVFLALAVGIVLGAGPLNEGISTGITEQVQQLTDEKNQLRTERDEALTTAASQDAWAEAVGPALVARQLGGRSVAVVELPGADSSQVDATVEVLEAAGASVSVQVTVQEAWTDDASADDREALVEQLADQARSAEEAAAGTTDTTTDGATDGTADGATQSPAPSTSQDAGTEDDLALALARALVTTELAQTGQPDDAPNSVLTTLADAGMIDVEGGADAATSRATLALVVGGAVDSDATDDQQAAVNTAWLALTRELDAASAGAVLAGPTGSADDGGAVAALRADSDAADAVSSVDDLDSPIGRVNAVLALRQQLSGDSGQYGTAGSATAVSPPLPAAAP